MNEIKLSELDVDTYLLQLKRYDSLNNSTIYDYYPSLGDGADLQYIEQSVLGPFLNNPDAKSSILYFLYQSLYSGKIILFAKNENFPLEPFASRYGSGFVNPGEAVEDYSTEAGRSGIQTLFEEFILSPIEDFTPPTQRRQIVYDFKFTSKGEIDNIGAQISATEIVTSTSTAEATETFSSSPPSAFAAVGERVSFGSGGTSGGSSGGY